MATALENINTAIDQITARIVEVTASQQPDYSIDGQSVSKGSYLTQLQSTLSEFLTLRQRLQGPFMVVSRGRA